MLGKGAAVADVRGTQTRHRPEKTLPKNPNRLTLNQYVFPVRSIGRFVGDNGCVTVCDLLRHRIVLLRRTMRCSVPGAHGTSGRRPVT